MPTPNMGPDNPIVGSLLSMDRTNQDHRLQGFKTHHNERTGGAGRDSGKQGDKTGQRRSLASKALFDPTQLYCSQLQKAEVTVCKQKKHQNQKEWLGEGTNQPKRKNTRGNVLTQVKQHRTLGAGRDISL